MRDSKSYKSLPYNRKLTGYARDLRKARNLAEALLWNELKNGKFHGLDFDRQKIIGNFIADFYCATLGLVIEIDGASHDNKVDYDKKRDEYMNSLGLSILRVQDREVRKEIESVMIKLEYQLADINRKKKCN